MPAYLWTAQGEVLLGPLALALALLLLLESLASVILAAVSMELRFPETERRLTPSMVSLAPVMVRRRRIFWNVDGWDVENCMMDGWMDGWMNEFE